MLYKFVSWLAAGQLAEGAGSSGHGADAARDQDDAGVEKRGAVVVARRVQAAGRDEQLRGRQCRGAGDGAQRGGDGGAAHRQARSLQLAPTYAAAHYNLAWAFKKTREPRKALKHWQAYVKLDTSGPWSVHARSQIKRILQADGLKLIHGANRG